MNDSEKVDDEFWLYDLEVETVTTDRPMVCSHRAGEHFRVEGENLVFSAGHLRNWRLTSRMMASRRSSTHWDSGGSRARRRWRSSAGRPTL